MYSFVVPLLITLATADPDYSFQPLGRNSELLFEKIGNLKLYTQFWNLIVYLDLENYHLELDAVYSYYQNAEQLCDYANSHNITSDLCSSLNSTLYNEVNSVSIQNDLILQLLGVEDHSKPIRKRGLLNVVGEISKTLFGTLDDSDAKFYNDQIEMIRANQSQLFEITQRQTSILESTIHLLNTSRANSLNYCKMVNEQLRQVMSSVSTYESKETEINYQSKVSLKLNEYISALGIVLSSFKLSQNSLLDIVALGQRGILHPLVISPRKIISELLSKQHYLRELHFPLTLDIENIQLLYRIAQTHVLFSHNRLSFVIRIPLLQPRMYDVLKISSVPIHLSKSTYQIIIPQTPYIVIDKEKQHYFYVNQLELSQFQYVSNMYLSQQEKPIYFSGSRSDCEINKLMLKSEENEICNNRLVNLTNSLFIQLAQANSWIYASSYTEYLQINCKFNNNQLTIPLNGTGLLRVNKNCSANTKYLSLPTHNEFKSEISIIFLPYLAKIQNITLPSLDNGEIMIPPFPSSIIVNSDDDQLKTLTRKLEAVKDYQSIVHHIPGVSKHELMLYVISFCLVLLVSAYVIYSKFAEAKKSKVNSCSTPIPEVKDVEANGSTEESSVDCVSNENCTPNKRYNFQK